MLVYPVGVVLMAGALVSLDSEGAVVVYRGLLREDEAKAQQRGAEAEDDAREAGTQEQTEGELPALTISEKLARRCWHTVPPLRRRKS